MTPSESGKLGAAARARNLAASAPPGRDAAIVAGFERGLSYRSIVALVPGSSPWVIRATLRRLGIRRPEGVTQGRRHRRAPLPEAVGGYMVPTEGDRDTECSSYSACLTAHLSAHRGRRGDEVPASCPVGCRWRTDADRPGAVAYVSLNGAARGVSP